MKKYRTIIVIIVSILTALVPYLSAVDTFDHSAGPEENNFDIISFPDSEVSGSLNSKKYYFACEYISNRLLEIEIFHPPKI